MMISKVNQIGFLSQVFKYLLTDLVRFYDGYDSLYTLDNGHGTILQDCTWRRVHGPYIPLASNAGAAGGES